MEDLSRELVLPGCVKTSHCLTLKCVAHVAHALSKLRELVQAVSVSVALRLPHAATAAVEVGTT